MSDLKDFKHAAGRCIKALRLQARESRTPGDPYGGLMFADDAETLSKGLEQIARLQNENRALREAMRWKPIETAPLEVSVIVYCRIHGRFMAYKERIGDSNSEQWCKWDGEKGILPPTHWMPLPPPPQEASDE